MRVPACNDFAMWAKASCFDVVYAWRDLLDTPDFPDNLRQDRIIRAHRNHWFWMSHPYDLFFLFQEEADAAMRGAIGKNGVIQRSVHVGLFVNRTCTMQATADRGVILYESRLLPGCGESYSSR